MDSESGRMLLPEGDYNRQIPLRPFLILNPPVAVKGFPQAKSVFMRGSQGTTLRPDLSGPHIGPGPITSVRPGVINPVSAIGMFETQSAPAHIQLDYVVSNPVSLFRETVDRFRGAPPPTFLFPPNSPPSELSGASIDSQIPPGKRIRPLWPI